MALTVIDVVKKVIALAIVTLMIATVDFIIFQAPNHGALLIPRTNDPGIRQAVIDYYHLDDSLIVQYSDFLKHYFTGDFGVDVVAYKGLPIQNFIWNSAANTLFLFGSISLLSMLAGSALVAVWRRRASSISGKGIMGFSILASSVLPAGIPLIIYSTIVKADLPIPIRGSRSEWNYLDSTMSIDGIVDLAQHAMIPILSGVLITFGLFALVLMFGMQKNPIAGARRLEGFWKALDSEMPFPGYLVAWSMTSVLIVDVASSYRGLGYLLWEALITRDAQLLMVSFFVISLMVAVSIFILDLVVSALKDGPQKNGLPQNATAMAGNSARTPKSFNQILSGSWAIYSKSLSGIVALLVLIVMVVAALAAPLISTVENPNHVANYEPSDIAAGWRNPLPPSFERSPYTGFRHPLGTDFIGQDIYSMTVYGLRPALTTTALIFVAVLAIGILIGVFSAATRGVAGIVEKGSRAVFSVGSLGLLAIPPVVILIGTTFSLSLHHWGVVLAFCFIYSMWSWSAISRVARTKSAGEVVRVGAGGVDWPKVAAAILHVTKFGVLIGLMAIMLLDFFGLSDPTMISWGAMLESAYERDAFIYGFWAWILAPLVSILILVSTTFVILRQLEKTVERVGMMSEETARHGV